MWYEYLPSILNGALVTLEVALLSLALAVALGLAGALAKLSSSRALRFAATIYTSIIRGIPDLVLMLLIFFGGQLMINNLTDRMGWDQVDFNPFMAGVATIGFIFGAYFTETFRGAFMAVAKGPLEAGTAFGMTRWQVFSRIQFPQMLRFAITPAGNNWQVMLKSTALVSMIGLKDMTYLADQAGRSIRQPFLFFFIVCLLYLAMTWGSQMVLKALDKRFSRGVRAGAL